MNTSCVRHVPTSDTLAGRGIIGSLMASQPKPLRVDLANGAVHAWLPRRGTTLRVAEGSVWVTQEGDDRDLILTPGHSLQVEARGRVVAQSLSGPAQLQVFAS